MASLLDLGDLCVKRLVVLPSSHPPLRALSTLHKAHDQTNGEDHGHSCSSLLSNISLLILQHADIAIRRIAVDGHLRDASLSLLILRGAPEHEGRQTQCAKA